MIAHDKYANSIDQPYQYVGQLGYYTHYQDFEFGLLQLGVRYYDPEKGRFTQMDIQKEGLDLFLYVDDEPLSFVDPDGEKKKRKLKPKPKPKPKPIKIIGKIFGYTTACYYGGCFLALYDLLEEPISEGGCGSNPFSWTPECFCEKIKDLYDYTKVDKDKPIWRQLPELYARKCIKYVWDNVQDYCENLK